MIAAGRYDAWADALSAAMLLAVDPLGLGGAVVRDLPGPARDAWLAALKAMLPPDTPIRRMPTHIDDERLLGGLDLAATLAVGRPVASRGLLKECDSGVLLMTMAERCSAATGARIAAVLDTGRVIPTRGGESEAAAAQFLVIALEEGVEVDETTPSVVTTRLAFALDLGGVRPEGATAPQHEKIVSARENLRRMKPSDERTIEAICAASSAFGVDDARTALFTLRAARAAAVFAGRASIAEEDLALAARLVLAPRAHFAPPEQAPDAPPPDEGDGDASEPQVESDAAADRMVDAVQSALQSDFLSALTKVRAERRKEARARGAGAAAKSARRGRPLGARAGTLRTGQRLDLVATLRAAAPWQPLRRLESAPSAALVHVRRQDFRIRRFVQRLESTIVFVVDASGSAALQRLAEAKGATETLLADAYVTRARVALVAFRNSDADLLLPPTRSLARAKRALAELPGGGATPLATAIDAASLLAQSERAKGRTPLVVFLTDGRANVGRDGAPGRAQAEADAMLAARGMRAAALPAVFIDTSPRARAGAAELAAEMDATYAPLPFLEANAVANVVRASVPTRR